MKELGKKTERKPAIHYTSLKNSLKARQFPIKNSDLLEGPLDTSPTTQFATGKNFLNGQTMT
jgi:hypothetical protein